MQIVFKRFNKKFIWGLTVKLVPLLCLCGPGQLNTLSHNTILPQICQGVNIFFNNPIFPRELLPVKFWERGTQRKFWVLSNFENSWQLGSCKFSPSIFGNSCENLTHIKIWRQLRFDTSQNLTRKQLAAHLFLYKK